MNFLIGLYIKELMEPLIDGFSFDNMYEHFMRLLQQWLMKRNFI